MKRTWIIVPVCAVLAATSWAQSPADSPAAAANTPAASDQMVRPGEAESVPAVSTEIPFLLMAPGAESNPTGSQDGKTTGTTETSDDATTTALEATDEATTDTMEPEPTPEPESTPIPPLLTPRPDPSQPLTEDEKRLQDYGKKAHEALEQIRQQRMQQKAATPAPTPDAGLEATPEPATE